MSFRHLLTKLGKGERLAPSEQAELEFLAGKLDATWRYVETHVQPGTSDSAFDRVQWKTAYGEVLPHEIGRLADDELSIATGAGDTDPAWDSTLADTYAYGMDLDYTNGYIYLNRLPRNSVVAVFYDVDFSANATGQRYLKLITNLTSPLHTHYVTNEGASVAAVIEGTHFIRCVTDLQYVKMVVGHTSGGTLTVNARLTALRVR